MVPRFPSRLRRPLLILSVPLVLGAAGLAAAVALGALASGAATTHATRYVSAKGSDGGNCTSARPCNSFERAYHVARPGSTIVVRGGRYGPQKIPVDSRKARSARRIVFRPAGGARVRLESLAIYGKHLVIQHMRVRTWWYVEPGARDVVIRNVTTQSLNISSASRISVIGGSVGPGTDINNEIKACPGCSAPRHIRISGVRFHDWVKRTPGSHVDCLHVMAANGLVIEKSRFENCEAFDILFTKYGAGTPRNVRIENNFLSCCRSGPYSVYLGGGHGERYENYLIRNNSTNKTMAVCGNCTILGGIRFYANIAPSIGGTGGCVKPGVSGDYNILRGGGRCGPHDRFAPSGFVDAAASDFRLEKGAAAIDHGDPKSHPAKDIFSHRRPRGQAPDAGAEEAR